MQKLPYLKSPLFILLLFISTSLSIAQEASTKVSFIGENEKEYEQMMSECSSSLLYIADNNMEEAHDIWTKMLSDMTIKADDQGLDIKGVKLWINLFWEADGSIRKIVYYPKPKSKNMDFDQLTLFFQSFAEDYNLDIDYESCFSHHGTAAFPVKPISILEDLDETEKQTKKIKGRN